MTVVIGIGIMGTRYIHMLRGMGGFVEQMVFCMPISMMQNLGAFGRQHERAPKTRGNGACVLICNREEQRV